MPRHERKRHVVRGVLVGVMAAAAFGGMAAGTSQVALADPPAATSDSGDSGQSRLVKAKARVWTFMLNMATPPDITDPHYKTKVLKQILANRAITKLGGGGSSLSLSLSDLDGLITDYFEFDRRTKQTVSGLESRMEKMDEHVQRLEKKVREADTTKTRKAALKKLEQAKKNRVALKKLYKDAQRHTEPADWDKRVKHLDNKVKELEKRINGRHRSAAAKERMEKRLAETRAELEQAEKDRARYKGPRDDGDGTGDTGATPAKNDPGGPKTPSTGTAKTPKDTNTAKTSATSTVKTGKGAKAVTSKTGVTVVPKSGVKTVTPKTVVTTPRVGKLAPFVVPKVKLPLGTRGSRGSLTSAVIGETSSLLVQGYLEQEHQKWYEKALKDEKLRKRIIADSKDLQDNSPFDDWARAFDGSKEFAQGTTRAIAEDLIKYQRSLDADRNAKKSNSDPLYLQARRECGSYDTCVRERVKKLRHQASAKPQQTTTTPKNTTPKKTTTTQKADSALAKKQYEEANRVCGGYDTCVKDRLAKVRSTGAKATKTGTTKKTNK